jgi:hypothetical protein
MPATGLLLPPGVVQPFDLHRLHDDLHVMAFIDGHPVYEAVEAMIRRSAGGVVAIRAILTRHDQSQIDHVNDDGLFAAARFAGRQTCRCEIVLGESMAGDRPRARLEFVAHDGAPVVLDVTAASIPDRSRAGLTDPGRHAEGTSLPLMWRGASAFAAPSSQVTIAGVAWPIPARLRDGTGFVAHEGFFTRSHDMLILRAGAVPTTILEQPTEWAVGARWTYATAAGERSYRIRALAGDGRVELERLGPIAEIVEGRRLGDRLALHRIDSPAAGPRAGRASLAFDAANGFAFRLEGTPGSVEGEVRCDDDDAIHLLPRQPAWATARAARLQFSRSGDRFVVTTSIG